MNPHPPGRWGRPAPARDCGGQHRPPRDSTPTQHPLSQEDLGGQRGMAAPAPRTSEPVRCGRFRHQPLGAPCDARAEPAARGAAVRGALLCRRGSWGAFPVTRKSGPPLRRARGQRPGPGVAEMPSGPPGPVLRALRRAPCKPASLMQDVATLGVPLGSPERQRGAQHYAARLRPPRSRGRPA